MPANSDKTRERILLVAERLFAERGLDGASMRSLAAGADVPLALVSYHFGSKDALYRAIFQHRYGPPTEERLRRLRAVEREPATPDRVERLVAAFLEPILALRRERGSRYFAALLAREASDPREAKRGLLAEFFDPQAKAFLGAFERALPALSKADVAWGYQFLIGALVMHLGDAGRITRLSAGAAKSTDTAAAFARLVHFAAAGLRGISAASAPRARATRRKS